MVFNRNSTHTGDDVGRLLLFVPCYVLHTPSFTIVIVLVGNLASFSMYICIIIIIIVDASVSYGDVLFSR